MIGYLKHAVGADIPAAYCKATIRPDLCNAGHQLYRDMKRAGIEMIPATSANSADDLVVKKCVCEFFCQPNIVEIVVVSGDHDIVGQTLELANRYKEMGRICKLYILASTTPDTRSQSPLGRSTLNAIEACAYAYFVGLETIVKTCAFVGTRH